MTTETKKPRKKRGISVIKENKEKYTNEEMSFLDKFYQARESEETWKTGGQNYIWVEDKKEGCTIGEVISRNSETNEFEVLTQNGEKQNVPIALIFPMNGPDFDLCEDMSSLYHLNNYTILQNIKSRYEKNLIYTFFGNTLLSLNPYQDLPSMFSKKQMNLHTGARKDTIEPHIYTVGDKAYFDVIKLSINQSILLFGESSSGKSKNMQHLIEYIGNVSNEETNSEMLLSALVILESFANYGSSKSSKTSSCLNLVELKFSKNKYSGSFINPQLVNPNRVVDSKNGRNFNIFYEILADEELIKKYELKEVSEYKLLNSVIIPGVNDSECFKDLVDAAEYLDFSLDDYFKICISILKIGNLEIGEDGLISNEEYKEEAIYISNLLDISSEEVEKLTSKTKTNFIQVLYYQMFNQLIFDINQKLAPKDTITNYISIIDIPGYQNFETNHFDQFCINFSNDQLKHLNYDIFFKKEQEIYVKERIDWKYIDFGINESFTKNQNDLIKSIEGEIEAKTNKTIDIEHSFGKLTYDFDNWNHLNLLQFKSEMKSENKLINKILSNMKNETKLTAEIQNKLSALFSIMQSTRFQQVLCLIPNELQKPSIIDSNSILKQIDMNNILQIIKMTRKGYIDHFNHSDFLKRYFMLSSKVEKSSNDDDEISECKDILKGCLGAKQFKFGKELVLLKYAQVFLLEEMRAKRILEVIIELQAISRMTLEQKKFIEMKQKSKNSAPATPRNDERIPELLQEIEEMRKKYQTVLEKTKVLTEKYNELKKENINISNVNLEKLKNEISKLQNEKKNEIKKIESKEEEIQKLKENEMKLTIELEEIKKDRKILTQSVNEENNKTNKSLNDEIDKLKRISLKHENSMEKEIKNLEDELKKSKEEISRVSSKLKEEQRKFENKSDEKKKLEKELHEKLVSLKAIQLEKESSKKSKSGLAKTIIIFSFSIVVVAAVSFYAGNKMKINQ
eukprot:gene11014-3720_t